MKTIAEQWDGYEFNVYYGRMSPEQTSEMRNAFYAGASAALLSINEGQQQGGELGAAEAWSQCVSEVQEFNELVQKGEA
jgi:hypothetical protein